MKSSGGATIFAGATKSGRGHHGKRRKSARGLRLRAGCGTLNTHSGRRDPDAFPTRTDSPRQTARVWSTGRSLHGKKLRIRARRTMLRRALRASVPLAMQRAGGYNITIYKQTVQSGTVCFGGRVSDFPVGADASVRPAGSADFTEICGKFVTFPAGRCGLGPYTDGSVFALPRENRTSGYKHIY